MNNKWTVKEKTELLKFLYQIMPKKSRNSVKSILSRGQVSINGRTTTQFNDPLHPGDHLQIKNKVMPADMKLKGINILYEDDDLLVVEKDAGLLTIATNTERELTAYRQLTDYVRTTQPKKQLFIVHRLDRDTSGLLIFAKNKQAQQKLQQTWSDSVKERTYIALVEGNVSKGGTVTSYLTEGKTHFVHSSKKDNGGKKAITHYTVLKTNHHMSLLKVNLETGRKNQIRVHMQDIGHPVVGDKKYGGTTNTIRRLGLHAHILRFVHPATGKTLSFTSPTPPVFSRTMKKG